MSLMLWLYTHVYLLYNRSYINFKNNKHVAEKRGGSNQLNPPLDPALEYGNMYRTRWESFYFGHLGTRKVLVSLIERYPHFRGQNVHKMLYSGMQCLRQYKLS